MTTWNCHDTLMNIIMAITSNVVIYTSTKNQKYIVKQMLDILGETW